MRVWHQKSNTPGHSWHQKSNLQGDSLGNHCYCKECLYPHLLKAAAHEAMSNPLLDLVPCADDSQPEWVTYPYRTAYPILRLLPSKLGVWLAEILGAIPAKLGDKWTVEELNMILVNILVSSGPNGGHHLRTFGAIQWECECELYRDRGRPKARRLARCYPFMASSSGWRARAGCPSRGGCHSLRRAVAGRPRAVDRARTGRDAPPSGRAAPCLDGVGGGLLAVAGGGGEGCSISEKPQPS